MGRRPDDAKWNLKFKELEAIAHENGGDPNVPISHPTHGIWLRNQRKLYAKGKLAPERVQALEALGVVWNVYDTHWDEMWKGLKAIARENGGDPNVPQNHPTHGMWLNTQRASYAKGKLAPERVQALESLGVVWNPKRGRKKRGG